jgi:hypothetical protein
VAVVAAANPDEWPLRTGLPPRDEVAVAPRVTVRTPFGEPDKTACTSRDIDEKGRVTAEEPDFVETEPWLHTHPRPTGDLLPEWLPGGDPRLHELLQSAVFPDGLLPAPGLSAGDVSEGG